MNTESTTATATARQGRLQDKVVLITGASSGIGRATMEIAGREGAKVVGTARTESKLQEGLDAVKAAGGDGIIVPADLEDVTSQDRVVQAALDAFGRVDVLINNAGVGWQYGLDNPGTMAGIHEASLDNWRAIIGGVDLEGYFLAIHAVLPKMIEQGSGAIVSTSSAFMPWRANSARSTSMRIWGFPTLASSDKSATPGIEASTGLSCALSRSSSPSSWP